MVKIYILSILLFLPLFSYAERIQLKNGKIIEAAIIEETDEYIKIDISGIPITYYAIEIESIDGQPVSAISSKIPQVLSEKLIPAIVQITNIVENKEQFLGSGFIVESNGIVITNCHVIFSIPKIGQMCVKLRDGRHYPIRQVIYYDAFHDFCIIKIDAEGLPVISLGDSRSIKKGEVVYALFVPLGYTFYKGLISRIKHFRYFTWFQSTAPVIPGSSGSPLINTKGEAIGITTYANMINLKQERPMSIALGIEEVKPFIRHSGIPFRQFLINEERTWQGYYYISLGFSFIWQKDFDSAIRYGKKALDSGFCPTEALRLLAGCYYSINRQPDAIECLKKILEIDSADIDAYIDIAKCYYVLNRYNDAIVYLEKAAQLAPDFEELYFYLALVHDSLKQSNEAIEYLNKALAIDSHYAEAHYVLGCILKRQDQAEQALVHLKKAVEIDPGHIEANLALANLYILLNRLPEAIVYCQRTIALDRNNVSAYNSLGAAYGLMHQPAKARACYEKAIQIDYNYANAYVVLGFVYQELGQAAKAKENFEKAKDLYQKRGNTEDAKKIEGYIAELH